MTYDMRKKRRAARRGEDEAPAPRMQEETPRPRARVPWRLLAAMLVAAAGWWALMSR
ncbi:MAG: hypothetical protein ACLGIN_00980 [Candidatus Sericytochromatia bacterium]